MEHQDKYLTAPMCLAQELEPCTFGALLAQPETVVKLNIIGDRDRNLQQITRQRGYGKGNLGWLGLIESTKTVEDGRCPIGCICRKHIPPDRLVAAVPE